MKKYQATMTKGLPLEVMVIPCTSLQEAMVIATALNTGSVNTRVLYREKSWCIVGECDKIYGVVKV